jgi:hypothetical protein
MLLAPQVLNPKREGMMYAVHTLSLLVLLAPLLHGADGRRDRQSWDNLAMLHAGQKVQVKTQDTGKWKGTFLSFTPDSISIHAKNRDREIPRGEVQTVKRKSAAVRVRHTLIGAGIGAAAGAGIALPNINQGEAAYNAVGFAGLAMVTATVVGAVLPAYSTVYEAGP